MRIPANLKSKVDEIIDEEDGTYFVWLARGWAFEPNEDERSASHCMGMFDNLADIKRQLKYISKCPCQYCAGLVN